ncbi:hypothetical protein GCM10020254_04520 [Streptomyces goshikiensis]
MNQGRIALSAPCPEFKEGGDLHQPSCLYHGVVNEPVWLMTRTGIYNENLAYLPGTDELWMVNERPEERMAYRTTWPTPPALAGLVNLTAGDFTGDGKQDIVGIEATTGKLWLYPGNGNGTLGARIQIGSGWNGMNHLAAGDFNADGRSDLLALETATGTLQLYPGTGALTGMNTLGARTQIGTGWGAMRSLTSVDLNKDGKPDLLAVDPAGALWAYPGSGSALGSRRQIGAGWNSLSELTSPGDLNGDGNADLVAVDQGGNLWTYPGTGALTGMNTLGARTRMGTNWDSMRQLTGGDFNGDGKGDLAAVEAPRDHDRKPLPLPRHRDDRLRRARPDRHRLVARTSARAANVGAKNPAERLLLEQLLRPGDGGRECAGWCAGVCCFRVPLVGRMGVAVSKCQGHVQAICVWCAGDCDGNVRFW